MVHSVYARNYLIKTESFLEITSEQHNIQLDPLGEPSTFEIKIKYTYNRLARPEGFPFQRNLQPVRINFSIIKIPEWCISSFDRGSFEVPISTFLFKKNETVELSTNISITLIDSSTPSDENDTIQYKVESYENGNIQAASTAYEISVTPLPMDNIETNVKQSSIVNLFAKQAKNIEVNIKNTGNTKLSIEVNPINRSKEIYLGINKKDSSKDLILDIGEEEIFILSFLSNDTIKEDKTIINNFLITGSRIDDSSENEFVSEEIQIQVNLFKDKELENNEESDLLTIFNYIILLLIIAPIVISYIYYKKNK